MLLENQNAKPSFISFGGLTLKVIYPLLMGASHILISISYELFDTDKVGNFNQYEYFLLLIMFFSESLISIVYLIHLYLSQSKSQSRRSILKPKQMKTQAKIKIILKIVLLLFICSTLDLIRNISTMNIRSSETITNFFEVILKIVSIPLISLLTVWILNYKYYRHHYIGYLITAFGLMIEPTYQLIMNSNSNYNIVLLLLFFTVFFLMGALLEVLEKYLMDIQYLSPYLIISVEGFIGIIVVSILLIFFKGETIVSTIEIDDFFECINLLKKGKFKIGIIIYVIGIFIYNILRLLTNQRCSPTHLIIADCFGSLLGWILYFLRQEQKVQKDFYIQLTLMGIGYVFIFIGLIIFLEFIVINKWGMNNNTTFNIQSRATEEIDNMPIINTSYSSFGSNNEKSNDSSMIQNTKKDIKVYNDDEIF